MQLTYIGKGWIAFMANITKRHNEIAHIITDCIRNMLGCNTPPLNENSTVFIPDEPHLPDRSSKFNRTYGFSPQILKRIRKLYPYAWILISQQVGNLLLTFGVITNWRNTNLLLMTSLLDIMTLLRSFVMGSEAWEVLVVNHLMKISLSSFATRKKIYLRFFEWSSNEADNRTFGLLKKTHELK